MFSCVRLHGLLSPVRTAGRPCRRPVASKRRSSFQQVFHRCGKVLALQDIEGFQLPAPTHEAGSVVMSTDPPPHQLWGRYDRSRHNLGRRRNSAPQMSSRKTPRPSPGRLPENADASSKVCLSKRCRAQIFFLVLDAAHYSTASDDDVNTLFPSETKNFFFARR